MIHTAFNGGAVTPRVHGRFDLSIYGSACETMENARALMHGGFERDPGLQHLGTPVANNRPRLIPATFADGSRYILEMTAGKCRVWTTGPSPAVVGTPLDTPYAADDLRSLQFARINDLIIFTHPDHPPQTLSRTGAATFEWQVFRFLRAPFDDLNTNSAHTIAVASSGGSTPSTWTDGASYGVGDVVSHSGTDYIANQAHTAASGVNEPDSGATYSVSTTCYYSWGGAYACTEDRALWSPLDSDAAFLPAGTAVDLTSSRAWFASSMEGCDLQLLLPMEIDQLRITEKLTGTTDTTTRSIVVDGEFVIQTYGNWEAKITVQESKDNGVTWTDILFYESDNNANYSETHQTDGDVWLRLAIDFAGSGTNNPRVTLTAQDGFMRGIVAINDVTDGQNATGTVKRAIRATTTDLHSLAAFCAHNGYPAAVTFHRQRLLFAGTTNGPQTIWASALDSYNDLYRRTGSSISADADQPFRLTIASDEQNLIHWLSSQSSLIVGTSSTEWIIDGDQQTGAFQPGAYHVLPLSHISSQPIRPINSEAGLIFVQGGGQHVRHIDRMSDVIYSTMEMPDDLSLYGEHLLHASIVEHAYQRRPEPTYWAVTADGRLTGFTHKPRQQVMAWHNHHLGDTTAIVSVAVATQDDGEDEIWLGLAHTLPDDSVTYTIERFALGQQSAQTSGDFPAFRYLHHWHAYEVTAATPETITDFGHLAGRNLHVLVNGHLQEIVTASASFEITTQESGIMVIGAPYLSRVTTLPGLVTGRDGTAGYLTNSQIGRMIVHPYRSGSFEVTTSASDQRKRYELRPHNLNLDAEPDLYDGPITIDGLGGWSNRPTVTIETDSPYPLHIRSLNYRLAPAEQV